MKMRKRLTPKTNLSLFLHPITQSRIALPVLWDIYMSKLLLEHLKLFQALHPGRAALPHAPTEPEVFQIFDFLVGHGRRFTLAKFSIFRALVVYERSEADVAFAL